MRAPRELIYTLDLGAGRANLADAPRVVGWPDVLDLWTEAADRAGMAPPKRRTDVLSAGDGALGEIPPCFSADDVDRGLEDYFSGVLHLVNRADAGHADESYTDFDAAEAAAWCFAQMLRIRPLVEGNRFLAEAVAWAFLRLTRVPAPLAPVFPTVVQTNTSNLLERSLDLAIELSLRCEGSNLSPGGFPPMPGPLPQDAFLAGWTAAQIVRWRNAPSAEIT